MTSKLHDCTAGPFLDFPSAKFIQADALRAADEVTATAESKDVNELAATRIFESGH